MSSHIHVSSMFIEHELKKLHITPTFTQRADAKRIVFVTGTRADYGKIKSLLHAVEHDFEVHIYVCGMHLLPAYGLTALEIYKDGFSNIHLAPAIHSEMMDVVLASMMRYFGEFIRTLQPDIIILHGDRLEALGGAIVGAFNNFLVAHIEGGEISGTIDESIRHAVTKLAHIHFVANEQARMRLLQLGEREDAVYVIGSPDIDLMLSANLPDLQEVKKYYNIPFSEYLLFLFHSVTTDTANLARDMNEILSALKESGHNVIVVYPNNDLGSEIIIRAFEAYEHEHNFKIFPSLRFEYFLTLLRHARAIVGNSSSGIREASVYGTHAINIGSRQNGRFTPSDSITQVNNVRELSHALAHIPVRHAPLSNFGAGSAAVQFKKIMQMGTIWMQSVQKKFIDLNAIP